MTHPDIFLKVKLGAYNGRPAVVVSSRTGEPFFWVTGTNHRAAMKNTRAFLDHAEEFAKLPVPTTTES